MWAVGFSAGYVSRTYYPFIFGGAETLVPRDLIEATILASIIAFGVPAGFLMSHKLQKRDAVAEK